MELEKLCDINLYQGDCMDLMRQYPDKYFDLAIVDPPYGAVELMIKGGGTNRLKEKMGWDIRPEQSYFNELLRISKNQIVWGGNYFTQNLKVSSRWIVWQKIGGLKNFPQFELAWTSTNVPNKIFSMSRADSQINKVDNKNSKHPCQKPVELYKWILKNYAKEGDKILDTHLGSGSSAIAAHDGGFEFTGIELDEEYYNAAKERLILHQRQLNLF